MNSKNVSQAEKIYGYLPADFDAEVYLDLHPDLAGVVNDYEEAAIHYLIHGRSELRGCTKRLIIALDGHDGSGKSTIADIISKTTGGEIVKPFGGAFGQYLLWLSGSRQYDLLCRVAQEEMDRAIREKPGSHPLIIDRHALTIGILVARAYHHRWRPLANTVLCFADFDTVMERLRKRGEHIGDVERHARGIRRYKDLAERNNVPIVTTAGQNPSLVASHVLKLLGLTKYTSEIGHEPA